MFAAFLKEQNMGRTSYALFGPDKNEESKGYGYEIVESVTSAIEHLVRMLTDKKKLEAKRYEMQFIKCSCYLIVRKRSPENYKKTHLSKAEAKTC